MKIYPILLLLLLLVAPAWSHGGEEHADLREAEAHQEATAATGPPKVTTREIELGGEKFQLTFRQMPGDPHLNDPVQLEVNIKKTLSPPDPLLGSEMTVEGAALTVTLQTPDKKSLGEAHAEAEPGTYGVHFVADHSGVFRTVWVLQQEGLAPLTFDHSFEVPRPRKQVIGIAVAIAALAGMGVISLLRRRMVWGGWVAALAVAAAALGVAFMPSGSGEVAPPAPSVAAESAQAPGLLIPTDLQRDLEMTVEPVREEAVPQNIKVPGTVRIPQGATHNLHARYPSRIISRAPRVGDVFRQGEVILTFEEVLSTADRATLRGQSIDLKARELEFATRQVELAGQFAELETQRQMALAEVTQRRLDLSRSEQLYAIQAIPKKELKAAQTAHKQAVAQVDGLEQQQQVLKRAPAAPDLPGPTALQQYSITAPVSGMVSQVEAAEEEVVEPSKVLVTLVNLSTVWVEARVSEKDLAAARAATQARISTVPYPGPFSGRFVSVSPSLDAETRTASVFFEVNNGDGKLLEGMSAEVEIAGPTTRALVLPKEALQTYENESRVFVRVGEDRFEPRTVQVIGFVDDQALVTGDISEGAPVVVQGAGALISELARRAGSVETLTAPTPPGAKATTMPHLNDGHTH
jgi:cobalt-zinc-cadmium efflux system membrane fusion protein